MSALSSTVLMWDNLHDDGNVGIRMDVFVIIKAIVFVCEVFVFHCELFGDETFL